jgi:hypothetical protein
LTIRKASRCPKTFCGKYVGPAVGFACQERRFQSGIAGGPLRIRHHKAASVDGTARTGLHAAGRGVSEGAIGTDTTTPGGVLPDVERRLIGNW